METVEARVAEPAGKTAGNEEQSGSGTTHEASTAADESRAGLYYRDPHGKVQGPFTTDHLQVLFWWFETAHASFGEGVVNTGHCASLIC